MRVSVQTLQTPQCHSNELANIWEFALYSAATILEMYTLARERLVGRLGEK